MKFIDVVQLIFAARHGGWHDGWDAGYAAGKQIEELNSETIYRDGFTEGIRQGKEEKEAELYEIKKKTYLCKLFGRAAL